MSYNGFIGCHNFLKNSFMYYVSTIQYQKVILIDMCRIEINVSHVPDVA